MQSPAQSPERHGQKRAFRKQLHTSCSFACANNVIGRKKTTGPLPASLDPPCARGVCPLCVPGTGACLLHAFAGKHACARPLSHEGGKKGVQAPISHRCVCGSPCIELPCPVWASFLQEWDCLPKALTARVCLWQDRAWQGSWHALSFSAARFCPRSLLLAVPGVRESPPALGTMMALSWGRSLACPRDPLASVSAPFLRIGPARPSGSV